MRVCSMSWIGPLDQPRAGSAPGGRDLRSAVVGPGRRCVWMARELARMRIHLRKRRGEQGRRGVGGGKE